MHPTRKEMMAVPIHINEDGLALCGATNGSLIDDFMQSECDACAKVLNENLQLVALVQITYANHDNRPEAALRQWIVKHPEQVVEAVSKIDSGGPALLIVHRTGKRV